MKKIDVIYLLTLFLLASGLWAEPSLSMVTEIPLPGNPTRFDYQSFDPESKTLYFSHMGDGELVVFNTETRNVITHIPGFPRTTGVLAVPELKKVYVSVPGNHEVAVIDSVTLKVTQRIPDGKFPDGLAYVPEFHKVFVSDESGEAETVIDTRTDKKLATIPMEGEVGNTQYDPVSKMILANVQTKNQLVVIDPASNKIVSRHTLTGGKYPHGLLIDATHRLAYIACQEDATLLVVDLKTFQVKQVLPIGKDPDVLAFDPELGRLYVGCESGVVSMLQYKENKLEKMEDFAAGPNCHTISVDSKTHLVYIPLKNINGHPVLRIMKPS